MTMLPHDFGLQANGKLYIERAIYSLVFLFAVLTVCYHVALIAGFSYNWLLSCYAFLFLCYCLVLARIGLGYFSTANEPRLAFSNGPERYAVLFLVLLCLASAALAVLSAKPNSDDVNYFALAFYAADHPNLPLLWRYPFSGMPDNGYFSIDIFQSYPYAVAAIGGILGVKPAFACHVIVPGITAICFTLAWYVLIRKHTEGRMAAILGVGAIVLLAATDGMTHRSIANFSLYRIWQGKVILMQVLTPIVIAASIDAFDRGERRDWLRLAALSISGIGLSATSQFFLPILAGLVLASYSIAFKKFDRLWKVVVVPFILGIYALPLTLSSLLTTPKNDAYEVDFGSSVLEVVERVYNWPFSITLLLFATAFAGLLIARQGQIARWIGVWLLLLLVPLLVPPITDIVVNYVTTSNAFWRLAYASPVILGIGLAVALAYEEKRLKSLVVASQVAFAGIALVVAALPLGISPLSRSPVRFPVIDYKLPVPTRRAAEAMERSLDGGTMLAAEPIAKTLPLLTGKFRQAAFRELDAPSLMQVEVSQESGIRLLGAFRYVSGEIGEDNYEALREYLSLSESAPDYIIVLENQDSDLYLAEDLVTAAGYSEALGNWGRFRVFSRNTHD